jgi:hypothetical protein
MAVVVGCKHKIVMEYHYSLRGEHGKCENTVCYRYNCMGEASALQLGVPVPVNTSGLSIILMLQRVTERTTKCVNSL